MQQVYLCDGGIIEAAALLENLRSLPPEKLAGAYLTPELVEKRIAFLHEKRAPLYDQMRAIDGAISMNEQWMEMLQMVQRGVEVKTTWGSTLR